jgi:hypothetical protein
MRGHGAARAVSLDDCYGCPDASGRFTCTITGRRRAPYMGACVDKTKRADRRVSAFDPRPAPAVAPRVRICTEPGCTTDISDTDLGPLYCGPCRLKHARFCINPNKKAARQVAVAPIRRDMSMTDTPTTFACAEDGCGRVFTSAQGLALHKTRVHSVKPGGALPVTTPDPAPLHRMADAAIPEQQAAAMSLSQPAPMTESEAMFVGNVPLPDGPALHAIVEAAFSEYDEPVNVEAEATLFAEALTTAQLVCDLRAEAVDTKVAFLDYVLHRHVPVFADEIMRDHVFPLIDAAEMHGESRAAL